MTVTMIVNGNFGREVIPDGNTKVINRHTKLDLGKLETVTRHNGKKLTRSTKELQLDGVFPAIGDFEKKSIKEIKDIKSKEV